MRVSVLSRVIGNADGLRFLFYALGINQSVFRKNDPNIERAYKMSAGVKRGLYLLVLMVGLAAAISAVAYFRGDYAEEGRKNTPYSGTLLQYDGWYAAHKDSTYTAITLPVYRETEGDSITIVNALPRELESGTYLVFESTNTYVTVAVDGEVIYQNLDNSVTQPLSMWNFIRLESTQAEGKISITFRGRDSYDVGILPRIYLGPRSDILLLANSETQFNTQISVIIIFFGVFIMLCSLVTFADMDYSADFVYLGMFIFVLGLSQWLQLAYPMGTPASWFEAQGTGRSLFGLLPPFFCLYRAERAAEPRKRVFRAAFWFGIGFYFLVFLMRWFASPILWTSLRITTFTVFEMIYGLCLYMTLFREEDGTRRYRALTGTGIALLMLGIGLESFTHLGYTSMHNARPLILGALSFSLMQTTAVLFSVFDHAEQQVKNARELSDSRIRLMMNQMRPHFIRSALGAIGTAIRQDPDKAYSLLRDFTNYTSFNIESMDSTELIPFREELKHIKAYTNIEQERYRPRVKVEYDIGPDRFEVPPLSIQPYVENAIKHGVWAKKEGGTVCLYTEDAGDAYVIRITDDGVGFNVDSPPPAMRGHGISMKNAAYRLEAQVHGTVRVESIMGQGTSVTVTIPKTEKEENDDENDAG